MKQTSLSARSTAATTDSLIGQSAPVHLLVVDAQHDFTRAEGALYVPGAEKAVDNIDRLLKSGRVARVLFTFDWHPIDHCSFRSQGGTWPVHCVQHTHGAALDNMLWGEHLAPLLPIFVTKGAERSQEEYGAFSDETSSLSSAAWQGFFAREATVVICGVAGDYCVLETLKNVQKFRSDAQLFLDGIASIDGGKCLNEYVAAHHVPLFA